MSKRHAILAAQEELHRLGLQEKVTNVHRSWEPRRVVVVTATGKKHVIDGDVASKLSAILRSRPIQARQKKLVFKDRKKLARDYRSAVSRVAEERVPAKNFWATVDKSGTR